jgi:glycosyltransferase involved in cell wall biosynthesis
MYNTPMLLSIVIPVYNEKDTLIELLNRVKAVTGIEKEIILVNDASTDGTTEILKDLEANDPYVKVFYHKVNQGKGAALRTGFQHTTGEYVLVQDADLEYDPNDYHKLLRALTEEGADVVYGSRFSGNYKDMSGLHYIGNKILTMITNLMYGVLLTDMETCYKLIPGNFARSMDIKSNRFNFEPEITSKLLKSKMKIVEVPISYAGRDFSEGKKITWRDGVAAFCTLVKFRFFD